MLTGYICPKCGMSEGIHIKGCNGYPILEPLDNKQFSLDPEDVMTEIINLRITVNEIIAHLKAKSEAA